MKKTLIFSVFALTIIHSNAQWELVQHITAPQNNYSGMAAVNDSTLFIGINVFDNWPSYRTCILKTEDYAVTWDTVYTINTDASGFLSFRDIYFIDEQIGWVCGTSMPFILKTTNGGLSWVEQPIPIEAEDAFERIKFYDENYGVALNRFVGQHAIETFDGGNTWLVNDSLTGYDVDFIDECNYIVNHPGWIKKTENCVIEYQDFPTSEDGNVPERNGRGIHLIDENTWLLAAQGLIGFNNFGSIVRTTNGGQSFQFLDLLFTQGAGLLHFYDSLNGYISLSSTNIANPPCAIMRTSDGGITWFCQETPIYEYPEGNFLYTTFDDIECPNPNIYYASTGNSIYRTFNGGGPLGEMWTAVEETNAKMDEFSVYPNPVHDILSLNIENLHSNETVQVNIFDALGQLLLTKNINTQSSIDVSQLKAGIYLLSIESKNGKVVKKFLKD